MKTRSTRSVELPSEVSSEVGFFDRFAGGAAGLASRAPFFAFCLFLVLVWLIQGSVTVLASRSFSQFLDATYQLEINTTTTILTFLMVALHRRGQAVASCSELERLHDVGGSRSRTPETRPAGESGRR